MQTALKCVFPGCNVQLAPEKALVPEIKAIRRAEGRSAVDASTLARHAHCEEHATLARRAGMKMYAYSATVTELEKRVADKKAAVAHFAKYATPTPETAMGAAFRKSGAAEQNGETATASA
jgi:hypothetical protein